jgi:hypothetical protein
VVTRRGDNIPPVSAYAHWNEDAERVWYEENRYDMEHADEIVEDDDDRRYDEPDPFEEAFETYDEAVAWMTKHDMKPNSDGVNLSDWGGKWYVEHYDKEAHEKHA